MESIQQISKRVSSANFWLQLPESQGHVYRRSQSVRHAMRVNLHPSAFPSFEALTCHFPMWSDRQWHFRPCASWPSFSTLQSAKCNQIKSLGFPPLVQGVPSTRGLWFGWLRFGLFQHLAWLVSHFCQNPICIGRQRNCQDQSQSLHGRELMEHPVHIQPC